MPNYETFEAYQGKLPSERIFETMKRAQKALKSLSGKVISIPESVRIIPPLEYDRMWFEMLDDLAEMVTMQEGKRLFPNEAEMHESRKKMLYMMTSAMEREMKKPIKTELNDA